MLGKLAVMFGGYFPAFLLIIFAALLAATIVAISMLLRPKKRAYVDLSPYECGVEQATKTGRPVKLKFFTIAILFLLFDAELALMYPWAALFREFVSDGLGREMLIEGLIFVSVLSIGLIYTLEAGALDWEK